MTIHTKKSPLTAPTANEDNKSIAERSNLTVPSHSSTWKATDDHL